MLMEDKDIIITRVSSKENHVDPSTKLLSHIMHDVRARSKGIRFFSEWV